MAVAWVVRYTRIHKALTRILEGQVADFPDRELRVNDGWWDGLTRETWQSLPPSERPHYLVISERVELKFSWLRRLMRAPTSKWVALLEVSIEPREGQLEVVIWDQRFWNDAVRRELEACSRAAGATGVKFE